MSAKKTFENMNYLLNSGKKEYSSALKELTKFMIEMNTSVDKTKKVLDILTIDPRAYVHEHPELTNTIEVVKEIVLGINNSQKEAQGKSQAQVFEFPNNINSDEEIVTEEPQTFGFAA